MKYRKLKQFLRAPEGAILTRLVSRNWPQLPRGTDTYRHWRKNGHYCLLLSLSLPPQRLCNGMVLRTCYRTLAMVLNPVLVLMGNRRFWWLRLYFIYVGCGSSGCSFWTDMIFLLRPHESILVTLSKRPSSNCLVHFYKRCVSNDGLWLLSDLICFLLADESHLIQSMVLAPKYSPLSTNGGFWLEKLYF